MILNYNNETSINGVKKMKVFTQMSQQQRVIPLTEKFEYFSCIKRSVLRFGYFE